VGIATCYELDGLGFEAGDTLGPSHPPIQWVQGFFHEAKVAQGVKLTTHFHLALRLRMSGAIPLLPLSAFMAWTGTASYNEAVQCEGV
jgi:hypothetical protein